MWYREYEIPRRFLIRPDDVEFIPVPRLLDCLHTCCQSCLEGMFQKNESQEIFCIECRNRQYVRSVRHLPPDGYALSHLIQIDGSSLSYCSRCHDEVPSFSWCGTCSTALCEFHHQDHKLSAHTAKHPVLTFKDINKNKILIEASLPPISCPEELEQDALLYCHECQYLLSAQV
jgi:hypothetical protein